MQEHDVIRGGLLTRQVAAIEPVVPGGGRYLIAQRLGKQLADPLHRMLAPGYGNSLVIQPASQGFAGGLAIQPNYWRLDAPRQQSAFQQSLGIDDQVIMTAVQTPAEALPLAGAQGFQRALAPAADSDRNHLGHGWMPQRNLREVLFANPVETDTAQRRLRIAQRRQGVNHIAHPS